MMKVARWCSIYGIASTIAMAILNLINGGGFDWSSIVFGFVISIAVYFYLTRVVEPQIEQYRDANHPSAPKADQDQDASKKRTRPKVKRK